MIQQESWQETSLAMAVENDALKRQVFHLVESIPVNKRPYSRDYIFDALLTCGLDESEINQFINGNLYLGE